MKILALLSGLFLLLSCNSTQQDPYQAIAMGPDVTIAEPEHPGKALMEQYCYACHNATTAEADRIGPPMIAIKKHYVGAETTKEEFTETMLDFLNDPTEAKAKMFGAVQRFGVMPKQVFPEDAIRQISDYVYDNEIEQPAWFEAHMKQQMGNGMGNCSENCSGNCQGMQQNKGKGMGKGMGRSRG
jgi:cytochrome c2